MNLEKQQGERQVDAVVRHPDHTKLEMLMLDVGLILTDEELSDEAKISRIKGKHLDLLRELVKEIGA